MRKRVTSSIFSSMYASIMSSLNTPPRVRNSRSLSRCSSASSSDEQTFGTFFAFFRRQIVQILVDRLARMDLVLHAVQACHQHRGEAQVRIGRRIREAHFDAARLSGSTRSGMRIDAERLRAE